MAHIDMEQRHCGTGEPAAAAGSNSLGMGSCIHKVWGRPAGTASSDCTASSGPYPAASPAGPPADDDRSSCRLGSLLQTNRVLSESGLELRGAALHDGGEIAVAGDGIVQQMISTSKITFDGWNGGVFQDDKAAVVVK